jgi:AraC-like DNA-binding protein
MKAAEFYTISSWVSVIIDFLEARGENKNTILNMIDLDPVLLSAHDVVPFDKISLLWRYTCEKYGAGVGLQIAAHFRPRNWSTLGVALQSSTNIDEFLTRVSQYSPMISDAVELRYEPSQFASKKLVTCFLQPAEYEAERMESYMAAGMKLVSLMSGDRLPYVAHVELTRPQPADPQAWYDIFGTNIRWKADEFALHFSEEVIRQEMPHVDAGLSRFMEKSLSARAEQKNIFTVGQQVKKEVLHLLPMGKPTIRSVAERMNMSPRSLQRHLEEEGMTFGALIDSLQLKLAQEYLSSSNRSLFEIALLTGFSNQSNFSNAFKRWTTHTPKQYRTSTQLAQAIQKDFKLPF